MSVRILTGDVRDMLATLPDESVHCVVTSPPYWGLRDYGVAGQLGMEPTMGEHIETMVAVFREVRRVLRKDGTVWLNYGSNYISGGTATNQSRPDPNDPACGSDDKAQPDFRDSDCAYPDPCDGHQGDSLIRRGRNPDIDQRHEQSQPPAGTTNHDNERSDFSSASPDASPCAAQASNTPSSPDYVPAANGREAKASAGQIADPTFSDDNFPSSRKDGYTTDTSEIQRLLVARNSDKEPLALACLYLSIASRQWKAKDLANVPNLLAEALQCDGWWVRSEIIWAKPNPMPESVTDRPATAHEKIWLLSKSARYFYDAEAVRTDDRGTDHSRNVLHRPEPSGGIMSPHEGIRIADGRNGSGANLRNVWTIPTKGVSGAHYATFPPDLIVPCIKAGTSEKGCCAECGAPWVREVEKSYGEDNSSTHHIAGGDKTIGQGWEGVQRRADVFTKILGWSPSCACAADIIPCTILDPFIGSGTTAMVADRLGRDCIGIDLNPANVEMATGRVRDDAGMFAEFA